MMLRTDNHKRLLRNLRLQIELRPEVPLTEIAMWNDALSLSVVQSLLIWDELVQRLQKMLLDPKGAEIYKAIQSNYRKQRAAEAKKYKLALGAKLMKLVPRVSQRALELRFWAQVRERQAAEEEAFELERDHKNGVIKARSKQPVQIEIIQED
ncbi:MAG: hypothetical protein Q9226_002982 [Calogaya cf. arnoldii]